MAVEDARHLERVDWSPRHDVDADAWPFALPAVAQLIHDGGLDVPGGVTFLVGENGSGKSTLVEALAQAFPRSGAAPATGPPASTEDSPLHRHLRPRTHPLASPDGFFLRAELMHDYLRDAEREPGAARAWAGEPLMARSHGEQFLMVLRQRFAEVGVYFLDEPESALSFRSCLGLLALLDDLRREGSQVVVATHSPLLTSLPDAALLELGDWGIRQVAYDDLELVASWRDFLTAPSRYLQHLLGHDTDPATQR